VEALQWQAVLGSDPHSGLFVRRVMSLLWLGFITFLCPLNSGTTLTISPVVAAALVTLISWLLSAPSVIHKSLLCILSYSCILPVNTDSAAARAGIAPYDKVFKVRTDSIFQRAI
jgi:hypothetical protein